MTSRHTLPWFLLTLLAATVAAACSKTPTTPTDATPTTQSEIYTGQLTVGGSQFYSFTTVAAGTTEITLTGLRPLNGPSAPFSAAIGVGLGIPQGTDCALSNAITTTPGLTKQLSVATNISIYCVKIADVGQLTGPIGTQSASYIPDMRASLLAIAIAAACVVGGCSKDTTTTPTTPTTPTSPTTSTLSSTLTVGGSVSRSFTASQAGTVTVTLTSAGTSANTTVGLGIGVPSAGVAACALSSSIRATPGASPQLTTAVDAGNYCVAIFDTGTLRDDIAFTLTIVFP